MALPTYVVELQFGSSSYIDVTSYVQSISISRGISRALDDYSAGTLSITFVNNSRVFDPLNTSSPLWYGAGGYTIVQPAGNIRVSSNGVRRFTGIIQTWDFSYDQSGFDGKATLTALDLMYEVGLVEFTNAFSSSLDPNFDVQPVVQSTGDRIDRVFNFNGFGASTYALVESGKTIVGADTNTSGDNVLAYMQNLARSEPADFFSNASAVMVMKDRSFTNYTWANTTRNNLIVYPGTATANIGENVYLPFGYMGWIYGGSNTSSSALYSGGSVNQATVNTTFNRYEMRFSEISSSKYNPDASASNPYSFSAWFRGEGLRSVNGGITLVLDIYNQTGDVIQTQTTSGTSVDAATWKQFTFTNTYAGTAFAGIDVRAYSGGTAGSNYFIANGWQFEKVASLANYFDGTYNPSTSSASTVVAVAWSGQPYRSYSGLVSSVASTAAAPAVHSFAAGNAQSIFNGTGIPFTDLAVAYASEQLYNKVEVIGVNATATAQDSTSQGLYGLRSYAQTDNLTTSTTKPAEIASAFLGEFRLPEYRAEKMTVALEALTAAQQNIVLAIEIRDIVRVAFQPSATGANVDKYYQVLGINANADLERDAITFNLASLDNLPFRLDSTYLGVLNTDFLA
jgi:hypothetical protein